MMADLATPAFLSSLKAIYPPIKFPDAPVYLWAVVAAVSFSASNAAEAVPLVFKYALDDLVQSQKQAGISEDVAHEQQLVLARKIREAILQSSMLSGAPRSINSLIALKGVTPEHLRETRILRDTKKSPEDCDKHGQEVFGAVYGDTAAATQQVLYDAYPDLGWFCTTVGYGMTYGGTNVLPTVELIYVMVSALIAMDSPRQIGWHLANARSGGASLDETRAVRQIAIDVASRSGVAWKSAIPEVES